MADETADVAFAVIAIRERRGPQATRPLFSGCDCGVDQGLQLTEDALLQQTPCC
jgi:hypothetical protein